MTNGDEVAELPFVSRHEIRGGDSYFTRVGEFLCSWASTITQSGRIWSRTILHRTSSNRQAYDSGNFCWNFPADLSSTVCNLCYDRSCGRNHGEKEGGKAQTQERTGL